MNIVTVGDDDHVEGNPDRHIKPKGRRHDKFRRLSNYQGRSDIRRNSRGTVTHLQIKVESDVRGQGRGDDEHPGKQNQQNTFFHTASIT